MERDAQYVRARGLQENSTKNLEIAKKLFVESARGGGGRFHDGELRARVVDAALRALSAEAPPAPPPPAPPPPPPPVRSSTVAAVPSP